MAKVSPTLQQSQQTRLDDINDKRRRLACQLRVLLDELDGLSLGQHMQSQANEERMALKAGYAALAKPLRSQKA